MPTDDTLYQKVIDVTHDYFGPAAERFVSRQIRNHLHKSPELLHEHDLAKLIDWMRLAMAVLTDDEGLIKTYVHDLRGLHGDLELKQEATAGNQVIVMTKQLERLPGEQRLKIVTRLSKETLKHKKGR